MDFPVETLRIESRESAFGLDVKRMERFGCHDFGGGVSGAVYGAEREAVLDEVEEGAGFGCHFRIFTLPEA